MDRMTPAHTNFIQRLCSVDGGLLTEDQAKQLARELCRQYRVETTFDDLIGTCSECLALSGLRLGSIVSEFNGIRHFGITNEVSDEFAKLATHFSPEELVFIKALILAIIKKGAGSCEINHTDALNVRPAKFSMEKAAHTISNLIKENWLRREEKRDEDDEDMYTLTDRAMLDLRKFIESEFDEDEIPRCTICDDPVYRGFTCQTPNCRNSMHKHCTHRYFQNKPEKSCPKCQARWDTQELAQAAEAAKQAAATAAASARASAAAASRPAASSSAPAASSQASQPEERARRGSRAR